jgi:hypothetical protein
MAAKDKINEASAAHAIGSIEELVEQVGDIIIQNANEWGAGNENDGTAHAIATIGVAFKILLRHVLPEFPEGIRIKDSAMVVFVDAVVNGIEESERLLLKKKYLKR